MGERKVTTQAEFDACIKAGDVAILVGGYFEISSDSATVRAYDSATVRAYDSATVTAYGSATVTAYDSATVTAYGSATVTAYGSATVTAYGSATVRAYDSATVTASGSATVRAYGSATVRAYDSATVTAYGSATVTAWGYVFVRLFSALKITATANVMIAKHGQARHGIEGEPRIAECPAPKTAAEWCEQYAVEIKDGIAIVYKGLDESFRSGHGADYTPGLTPIAADWDGGKRECGGGLHFSPRPWMALGFMPSAKKFVACPVALKDMRAPQDGDQYPHKIKAKGCAGPTCEVDIDGKPVVVKQKAA